jgi:hypothetical protein
VKSAASEQAGGAVRRLAVAGVTVAVVSFAVTMAVGLIEGTVAPYDRLDPDSEESVFDWASTGVTLVTAFLCTVHAIAVPRRRWAYGVLAGLLLYLSFDDAFRIHETVGTDLREDLGLAASIGARLWTAAYLPLLAVVVVLLWRVVRAGPPAGLKLLLTGLACFGGAIALEAVGATSLGTPLLFVVTEESLELAGWELVAAALTIVLVASIAWSLADESPPSTAAR